MNKEDNVTKVEFDRPIHEGIEFGVGLLIVYIAWSIIVFAVKVAYYSFTLA